MNAPTVQLRNPRTVGVCSYCPAEGRLFPCGWRCPTHAPQPHGAGQDTKPVRRLTLVGAA